MRSAELTLPGYVHDVCSAVHPLAVASPFFRDEPLGDFGLEMIEPDAPLAHPLDDGTAVVLERSVEATARGLGPDDADAYQKLMRPLVDHAGAIFDDLLGPLGFRPMRHPITSARFGLRAIRSARGLATSWFRGERARALFAGLAAHSVLPLDRPRDGRDRAGAGRRRARRRLAVPARRVAAASPTRWPPGSGRSAARS